LLTDVLFEGSAGQTILDVPFPPRVNANLSFAERHLPEWLTRFDLLPGTSARAHFASWRPVELPGRWYPDAGREGLALGTDLFGWLMLLDDQFDGPIGRRPEEVASVVDQLVLVIREPDSVPVESMFPAQAALRDIWIREREGMSATWRERAARNWTDYLRSYVTEAENRSEGLLLSLPDYLVLRDTTGIMPVLLDSAERAGRYEVPPPLYQSAELGEMYLLTVRVAGALNDLLGLRKEEKLGDPHNIVPVLQREENLSRQQALDTASAMVRNWIDRFVELERVIPAVNDRLGLAAGERTAGYLFIGDMRSAMRACYDWCAVSDRYSPESIVRLGENNCLHDILTPGGDR
jgi:hypothetical protein